MNDINIIIYTKSHCPNCITAKLIMDAVGLDYTEIDIELGNRLQNFIAEFPDGRQMPQIFINDQRVGGVAGLQAALRQLGMSI